MPSTDMGKLKLVLSAETDRFNKALAKSRKQTKSLGKGMRGAGRGAAAMGSAMAKLGGIMAGALGGRALIGMGKAAIAMGDDIAKASKRLGIGIETLQALQFEGKAAGIETEQLNKALLKFSVGLGEVATLGTGELKPALDAMNIGLEDAGGNFRSIDSLLVEFAQKLEGTGSTLERNALAADAFGQRGLVMVELLPKIALGLEGLERGGRAAGAIIDDHVVRSLEEAQDAMDRFGKVWDAEIARMVGGFAIDIGFGTNIAKLRREIERLELSEALGAPDPTADLGSRLPWWVTGAEPLDLSEALGAPDPTADLGSRLPWWVTGAEPEGSWDLSSFVPPSLDLDLPDVEVPPKLEALREELAEVEAAAEGAKSKLEELFQTGSGGETGRGAELPAWMKDANRMAGFGDAAGEIEERREFTLDLSDVQSGIEETDAAYNRFSSSLMTQNEIMGASVMTFASGFATSIGQALATGEFDFKSFARSAVASIGQIIAQQLILNAIMASPIGGIFKSGGVVEAARGLIVDHAAGGVIKPEPFAAGGIVDRPTLFAMGGTRLGLMGEAGPEGILPLRRDPSTGRLGVEASGMGGGGTSITVNVTNTAPNSAENDRRMGRVIAAQMRSAMNAELRTQLRPGGTLNPIASAI